MPASVPTTTNPAKVSAESRSLRALPDVDPATEAAASLASRLCLALYDLGLYGAVGDRWVSSAGAEVVFAPLDVRAADRLTRLLEDLPAPVPATDPAEVNPNQLSLFGRGQVS